MRDWPHSPIHRLADPGTYCVTGATYVKQPIFRGAERLEYLSDTCLAVCEKHRWRLQAWAVFPNHYHFVAASPASGVTLTPFTKELHSVTAIQANRWDHAVGRKVWFQYWETELTYPESYFARLSYVHRNAVHHGSCASLRFMRGVRRGGSSAAPTASFYKRIMTMKIDRVKIEDEFEVDPADL